MYLTIYYNYRWQQCTTLENFASKFDSISLIFINKFPYSLQWHSRRKDSLPRPCWKYRICFLGTPYELFRNIISYLPISYSLKFITWVPIYINIFLNTIKPFSNDFILFIKKNCYHGYMYDGYFYFDILCTYENTK